MRILKLHHPTGNPYWCDGEFEIELPDGTFYKKSKHTSHTPAWAEGTDYCDSHRIVVRKDGIYYQRCGASSGTGKTNYLEPFKIIDCSEYDSIEYVGEPLVMSDELKNEVNQMTK